MYTICILGAGQFGQSAARLLNKTHVKLLAFGDNNPALRGCFTLGVPILSVEEAVQLCPDQLLIGVIDEERSLQLKNQALACHYDGSFLTLRELYLKLDIRSGVLIRLAERIHQQQIPGNIGELGVYKGDTAVQLNALFPERSLYLFDTFEGFDSRDIGKEQVLNCSRANTGDFSDTSISAVISRLPFPDRAVIRKGYFPETAEELKDIQYAFVSLDADLYAPILAGLEYFYPRLSSGGAILLHDYNNARFRGAKQAVSDFEQRHGLLPLVPLCDLHGSAVILKP